MGGACAAPKLRLASPQDLWLQLQNLKFCLINSFIWTKQIFGTQYLFCKPKPFHLVFHLFFTQNFFWTPEFFWGTKKIFCTPFFGQKLFNTPNFVCAYIFCWPKILSRKMLESKILLWPNIFGTPYFIEPKNLKSKNILGQKKFESKKFWSKKMLVKKNFGPKKILVQKTNLVKKIFGQKKYWSKKNW